MMSDDDGENEKKPYYCHFYNEKLGIEQCAHVMQCALGSSLMTKLKISLLCNHNCIS